MANSGQSFTNMRQHGEIVALRSTGPTPRARSRFAMAPALTVAGAALDLPRRDPFTVEFARPTTRYVSPRIFAGLVQLVEFSVISAVGFLIAYLYVSEFFRQYAAALVVTSFAAISLFQALGLYGVGAFSTGHRHLPRLLLGWTASVALFVTTVFFLKLAPDFSRAWLAIWYVSGAVALLVVRVAVAALTRHGIARGQLTRRAVVYGSGPAAMSLLQALDADPSSDITVCGVFDDRGIDRARRSIAGHPNLGNIDALMHFCRHERVDLLIVALPLAAEMRVLQLLKKLWVLPVDIRLAAQASKIRFRPRCYSFAGSVPLLDLADKPIADWDIVLKWLFDKSVAALAIVALAPLMALIALAIKLDSKGPVFFRQKRYGFNNELIEVLKFRSMYTNQSDVNAAKLVTKNDPRVTRLGRILRKTSLDELPQLFNVMRGELSLVGPRPHALQAKAADRLYHDVVDGYFARHKVKPGITGWAQINGWRGETDTPEKIEKRVEHDLYYIDNWSVLLDFYILLRHRSRCCAPKTPTDAERASMSTLALRYPGSALPAARSATHWLALALVWLTIASGAIVATEPAPIDVLTMGLVVLLPTIGLVAITPALLALLSMLLVGAAAAVLAATNAVDIDLAMTHTGVTLYLYLATFIFAAFVAKRPRRTPVSCSTPTRGPRWRPRLRALSAISTWSTACTRP